MTMLRALMTLLVAATLQPQDGILPGGNVLSCETYSFNKLLRAKENPLAFEDLPAKYKALGIKGISLNDLYFKSYDEPYLEKLRGAIKDNGLVVTAFIIDINGQFAMKNDDARAKNVEAVRARLKVAKSMGAAVVRVNVGKVDKGEDDGTVGIERVIAAFKQLIPTAKELGLKLSIENHGGVSIKADWILAIIKGTDPEVVGSCLDFGNWPKEADRYAEITKLAPHAFHTHAKSHGFSDDGEEKDIDYARVVKIMKAAGYKGAVSIEWEGGSDTLEGIAKTRDVLLKHWK
jgi:sugar phosphate isomerase/epimerase